MPARVFIRGRFEPYEVVRSFALTWHGQAVLGPEIVQPNGDATTTVSVGTIVYFDGAEIIIEGEAHARPQFRGAIRAGWARPAFTAPPEPVLVRPTAWQRILED